MRKYSLIILGCILLLSACKKTNTTASTDAIDNSVDSLLALMTIEEKAGQLSLYTSDWDVTGPTIRAGYKEDIKAGKVGAIFNAYTANYTRALQKLAVENSRLHIPLIFGYDVIHGHRTMFPIPLGSASSWDIPAIQRSAAIAADEASAEGLHWAYGPMVDIARDPRWGRVAEGAGEDTYLGCKIAAAMVKGLQGEQLGSVHNVMASVKHFAAYGAALAGRDYNTVDMSERVLRDVYLPPYKAAVDAGAATVMTSFNEVDGVPASGNKFLLTDILRNEWGFRGFVVSDYTSIMEMLPHGIVADTAAAAALSLNAGLDMDMQAGFYQVAIPDLIKKGIVKEATLNESVRRVLRKKYELGLFKDPYRFSDSIREKETVMKPAYVDFARELSRKSIVLLKNDKNVLPLSKSVKRIAVIGPLAEARRELIGSWSAAADWKKSVTLVEGIKAKLGSTAQILYARGSNINDDTTKYIAEAVKIAAQSDVVILAVGEQGLMSGEASSRSSIELPGAQQKLVEEIAKTGKPVVVVLMNGRPLAIDWIDKHIPAILETWFLGHQAGNAIADVLFGDYNPSAKLTMSFPQNLGQVPVFYNNKNTGRPRDEKNKYSSKYLDVSNEPLYPFGYGLSYTTFSYSDLTLSHALKDDIDVLTVTGKITNTGKIAGEEVVQLYVRDLVGSVTRPLKELKGFQKVSIAPGETKEVTFTLTPNDLSFYRYDMTFGPEAGKFHVFMAPNSRDAKPFEFEVSSPSENKFEFVTR